MDENELELFGDIHRIRLLFADGPSSQWTFTSNSDRGDRFGSGRHEIGQIYVDIESWKCSR